MRFNKDTIALFCQDVKTHEDFTYYKGNKQITRDMVIDFDHKLFTDIISPDSKTYDAYICNFEFLGTHLFKPNQTKHGLTE